MLRFDIKKSIAKIQKQKVMVLGDLMLDEYIWGKVNRISPEAPVPVVHVSRQSAYPGGAANVARNLSDFGTRVTIGGIMGRDSDGKKLQLLLNRAGISTDAVIYSRKHSTIVKTRIIARQQQVVRVDRESVIPLNKAELKRLKALFEQIFQDIDAVIIEDYGKGFVTQQLVDQVVALAGRTGTIVSVDPNPNNPLHWSGATCVKPNRQEAFAAAGLPYTEDAKSLFRVGETLLDKWQVPYLLITLGEEGMILFQPSEKPYHTPTKAREVFDVSGAGDTAIAFFTAALASDMSGPEAAEIANHAAGIVIGKLGTATLHPDELVHSFKSQYD